MFISYLQILGQPTPVFLPGEPHGQRSLGGHSSEVSKSLKESQRSDRTEATEHTAHTMLCKGLEHPEALVSAYSTQISS